MGCGVVLAVVDTKQQLKSHSDFMPTQTATKNKFVQRQVSKVSIQGLPPPEIEHK